MYVHTNRIYFLFENLYRVYDVCCHVAAPEVLFFGKKKTGSDLSPFLFTWSQNFLR